MPTSENRASAPGLDDVIGIRFPVLDDGFIRVIDYMGNDSSIVQAARVSYGAGTKIVSDDRKLIRYLMRHRHSTPFEMCELKLHVRVPMDCWRQWIRHRTASVNEYSTRYSLAIDYKSKTEIKKWRLQSKSNRQGSVGYLPPTDGQRLSDRERELHDLSSQVYQERLDLDVAREQARKDLPLSTYTEAYWKIDLHNLLHFLLLRMDNNAQFEIRQYANVIGNEIVERWCPITWKAFVDYRKDNLVFAKSEIEIVRLLMANENEEALNLLTDLGWLEKGSRARIRSREREELEEKLDLIGVEYPW